MPGIVGAIQATETIKMMLGIGDSLVGRLLLVDALKMEFRELKLRKHPDCALCGSRATIHELAGYEEFCGQGPQHKKALLEAEISAGN